MAKRKKLQKKSVVAATVLLAALAMFGCQSDDNEKSIDPRLNVRIDDAIRRGFEAFSSNDLYNAEIIFSSFFDKKGHELNAFGKINYQQQLLVRSLYGDMLFRNQDFQKAEIIWRPLFQNQKLPKALSSEQKATVRWHYGYSLICEDKNEEAKIILAAFFDEKMKVKKSFETLKQEDQISCRVQCAQLLFAETNQENNFEKIEQLLEVFFDENGELTPQIKDSPLLDEILSLYGYVLHEQGNHLKAQKMLNHFAALKDKFLGKNFDADEINLIVSLCANINRMNVKQW